MPASVEGVLRSAGTPLDAATRAFMEPRFGHDFSHVRVHADGAAARSASAIGAAAYTAGSHVAFGAARYAPTTQEGRKLIAHELAHVVQQSTADRVVRRQPEDPARPALAENVKDATRRRAFAEAAEILNGYNAEGIKAALAALSRGDVASIHAGALENPRLGPGSAIANNTRGIYSDLNFRNALGAGRWTEAAKFLNAFMPSDISAELAKLSDQQIRASTRARSPSPGSARART